MAFDKDFVCRHAMPGIGCDMPEMILLASLFYIAFFVCIYFLFSTIKKSKSKYRVDQTTMFWIFMAICELYRGTVSLVPFNWTLTTYKLLFVGLDHILLFIPMCLVILILFNLLFAYRNPGTNAIIFFRYLFIIFLLTFLILAITISVVDVDSGTHPSESLDLWSACTDLILAIFFALPAKNLLEAVTYPMVQPDDECCVRFCSVGIALYVLLFLGRMVWNITHFFNVNYAEHWISEQPLVDGIPCISVRIISFFFYFCFDLLPAVFSIISVYLFRKHDMMFIENPYFTREYD